MHFGGALRDAEGEHGEAGDAGSGSNLSWPGQRPKKCRS